MIRTRSYLFMVICLLLAASACTPSGGDDGGTSTPTLVPGLPECAGSDLVTPQALLPHNGDLVTTLRPDFSWEADYACALHYYRVELRAPGGDLDFIETGPFTPPADLLPATTYEWRVAAVAWDGTVGPYSNWAYFVTGPLCTSAQSWRVLQDSPENGAIVGDASPDLLWHYPDASCVPEKYEFAVLNGSPTGSPAISGTTGGPFPGFATGLDYLQDCQLYYWRVDPVIGGSTVMNDIPTYFVTNFSNACPGLPCDAASLVAPVPLTPEDRSVYTSTTPVLTWNYPYLACLPDVTFHAEIARDAQFTDLLVTGDTAGWMSFDPAAAQLEDCHDYYWHVSAGTDGISGPYSPTIHFRTDLTGSCRRSGTVGKTAACYEGPGSVYRLLAWFYTGDRVELLGRSQNKAWLYIARPDGKVSCWMDASHLPDAGDLESLPVQFAPPVPTPTHTPPPACSTYSNQDSCDADSACSWIPNLNACHPKP